MRTVTIALLAFFEIVSPASSEDWRQFRGTDRTGVSREAGLPLKWSGTENIAWKNALPGRGLSSPIVVEDRVIVTCSSGFRQDRLHVICFDAKEGSKLWERQFTATGRTMTYPTTSNAAPTPCSDGKRIFALYSSNDLVCLDLDGNLMWYRGLTFDHPNASISLGMASSPVVVGDTLVAQVENDSESLATGVDVDSGISRWTLPRPKRVNWTSAVILPNGSGGEDLVLLQSSEGLVAIQPLSGREIWNYKDGASTIPSSVVSEGVIYVPSHGMTALRPFPEMIHPEVLWQISKLSPATPSPLVYNGRLYCTNGAGLLICSETSNGSEKWRLRLTGPFSSSPIAAGSHLYLFNEQGECHVVKPEDDNGQLVATNSLDEKIQCTPAISNGAIYVRSNGTLWKIASP